MGDGFKTDSLGFKQTYGLRQLGQSYMLSPEMFKPDPAILKHTGFGALESGTNTTTNNLIKCVSTGDVEVSIDSDLGKRITARREHLDKLRAAGIAPGQIALDESPLDDYVPVYRIRPGDPWNRGVIIGYRAKTEAEKSATVNYIG